MAREIVNIQTGNCGINIGFKFWYQLSREHCLDGNHFYNGENTFELEKIKVYYNENKGEKYTPRAILVDFERNSLNNIRTFSFYKPENIIYDQSGANHNWASGFYYKGPEIIDSIIEKVRKEIELCDCPQGFQLIHSLGGGTGSGLGTLILIQLQDEFPDQIISTFSVFPSQKVSDSFLEPYNCILSLKQLIESTDEVFYFDNEELYDFIFKTIKVNNPTYNELNYNATLAMSGLTSTLRFPLTINSDLRKIYLNHISYPHIKFLSPKFVPQSTRGATHCHMYKVNELIRDLFANKEDFYFKASLIFNGDFNPDEISEQVSALNHTIETNVNYAICPSKIDCFRKSATLLKNSSSFKKLIERQISNFDQLYDRKAFVHKYIDDGIEVEEFDEARSSVKDLIQEYEKYWEEEN